MSSYLFSFHRSSCPSSTHTPIQRGGRTKLFKFLSSEFTAKWWSNTKLNILKFCMMELQKDVTLKFQVVFILTKILCKDLMLLTFFKMLQMYMVRLATFIQEWYKPQISSSFVMGYHLSQHQFHNETFEEMISGLMRWKAKGNNYKKLHKWGTC